MILDMILTIHALGWAFVGATILLFVSVYFEQMAGAYKPADDGEAKADKLDFGGFALMVVTTLTPALQLVHSFFATLGLEGRYRLIAAAFPIAAMLLGALIGRLAGMGWKSGARLARGLVLPAALIAFVFTIYVTWPSIVALIDLLSGRSVHMRVLSPI